jgi:hypothetical protein
MRRPPANGLEELTLYSCQGLAPSVLEVTEGPPEAEYFAPPERSNDYRKGIEFPTSAEELERPIAERPPTPVPPF